MSATLAGRLLAEIFDSRNRERSSQPYAAIVEKRDGTRQEPDRDSERCIRKRYDVGQREVGWATAGTTCPSHLRPWRLPCARAKRSKPHRGDRSLASANNAQWGSNPDLTASSCTVEVKRPDRRGPRSASRIRTRT